MEAAGGRETQHNKPPSPYGPSSPVTLRAKTEISIRADFRQTANMTDDSTNTVLIRWLGHAAFMISMNGFVILIDPWLGNPKVRSRPILTYTWPS